MLSCSVVSDSLQSHRLQCQRSPPGSSVHGNFQGKNTGVGCHDLLQQIFPIQGSNPGLLHCRRTLYHLSQGWIPLWVTLQDTTKLLHKLMVPVHTPPSHVEAPATATAKLVQSCPTLCDPIDGSPPGSPDPGIA